MALNRAQFKKELQLGLNTIFGLEYKRYPEEWKQIFMVENSQKAYEEDVLSVGFGAAPVKSEGAGVAFDESADSYVARYYHETIALAFAITEEAEEDGLYGSLGKRYSAALARSLQQTKEVKGADILNNFASTVGGDGVSLGNVSHPLWGGGLGSNTMTAADLSEASIEAATIAISQFTDDRGIPIMAQPKKLIVTTNDQFTATKILNSQYQTSVNGSANSNNDINAVVFNNIIPGGFAVNHRLTDVDTWFIVTDVPDGLKHFVRKPVSRGMLGDFETGNMRYLARERYSFGWSDWRGIFCVPGAG